MSSNPLMKLDRARLYLAECRSLPEVKKIRDLALAAKAYAQAHKLGMESCNYAWEIQTVAEQRAAVFLDKQERGGGGDRKSKNQPPTQRAFDSPYKEALEEIGITTQEASRWRTVAEVPESVVSRYVAAVAEQREQATTKGLLAFASAKNGQAQVSSDSNEYYTLAEHIEAARTVLGEIDLDPASHPSANGIVKAAQFFTADDDGLAQEWHGRVWLNPPWGKAGPMFVEKLVGSYRRKEITAAVLLVNAHATDTAWFQPLWDYMLCFSSPRIRYWQPDGGGKSPNSGSVFVYLGSKGKHFVDVFEQFGAIVSRVKRMG
jgi:hypothetical protein